MSAHIYDDELNDIKILMINLRILILLKDGK